MNQLTAIGYGGLGCVAFAFALVTWAVARNPAAVPPKLGHRGLKRKRALDKGGLFPLVEPLVRFLAGLSAHFPITKLRHRIEEDLVHAGSWLGLTADEFLAMSFLSSVFFFVLGIVAAEVVHLGFGLAVFFAGLGIFLPRTRLSGEVADRFKAVNRQLPGAIDLAALCMGAGLDFPGALHQVVDKSPDKEDPLIEELARILQELDLGRTRRQALEHFADRVPTEAVRDFTGTVIQAEEKGNPLAEVLRIQAGMLRMRRSVMAEEAAARAGVLMMAPLMLIFCAIIIMLLGPFVINGMRSGF